MPRVAVNGVSLHYEEAGSGPPLLLIHAFPVGRHMWEPQIIAVARRCRWKTPDTGRLRHPR